MWGSGLSPQDQSNTNSVNISVRLILGRLRYGVGHGVEKQQTVLCVHSFGFEQFVQQRTGGLGRGDIGAGPLEGLL